MLIEKNLVIEVNFDAKIFEVIIELYQMIKLGHKLPGVFFGLGILNRTLLSDLMQLKCLVDKYNNIILNLSKESVSIAHI